MGEKPKRDHYVSRTYLRRFSDGGEQIHAYERKTGKIICTNLMNVAQQKGFYDIEVPGVSRTAVDDSFQNIDNMTGPLLDAIVDEANGGGISAKTRREMSLFLVISWFRTEAARSHMLNMTEQFYTGLVRRLIDEELGGRGKVKIRIDRSRASELQASMLFNEDQVVSFAVKLSLQHWAIGHNKTIQPFYTSDNPIVKVSLSDSPEKLSIFYPLSPKHILLISPTIQVASDDGRICKIYADGVEIFNQYQVASCRRFIFGSTPEFAQADGYLKTKPELKEKDDFVDPMVLNKIIEDGYQFLKRSRSV